MILMALYSQQRTFFFFSLTAMKELLVEVFASM